MLLIQCVLLPFVDMYRYLGAAVQNMSVGIDFSLVAALLAMVKLEGELDISVSFISSNLELFMYFASPPVHSDYLMPIINYSLSASFSPLYHLLYSYSLLPTGRLP